MSKVSSRSARWLVVAVIGVLLVIGGFSFYGNITNPPRGLTSKDKPLSLVGISKPMDAIQPGENPGSESSNLLASEDYWNSRLTYPTGQFNHAWVAQAAAQDSQIASAVPAGHVTYNHANSNSPLTLDPNAFTALGPAPEQTDGCQSCYNYGHVSGRVNDVTIDPTTPNVAYLASVGGGIWKTTNCCTTSTTWTPVTDSPLLSSSGVDAVTVDPSNHNNVYAGTGDLNFGSFAMGSSGLLKSTDQGATWSLMGQSVFTPPYPEPVGQFPQYQAIGKVKVDPRNSNNLVVGTKTGVYFSYDQGTTWAGPCLPDAFPAERQDITGLIVHDNGSSTDLFAAVGTRGFSTTVQYNLAENGANGIYKTTVPASGCPSTWTLSTTSSNGWPTGTGSGTPGYQTNGDQLGRIDIAIAPSNANYIYAQVQAINTNGGTQTGGQLGLWRTTDGGATWSKRSDQTALGGCGGDYNQNWYDQGVAVDPNNPNTLLMDTFDIWKSTDGGTTLTDETCGYGGGTTQHVDEHALFFVPGSSSTLLAGSDGGIYVSSDSGVSYHQINDTMNTIEFYSGDITGHFATSANPGANAGAQDNGSSVYQWSGNPGPALWQLEVGGDGFYARIEPMLGQRWYQENNSSHINLSQTGPTGTYVDISGGWTSDTRSFTTPFEIFKNGCPVTCDHLIVGSNRVWETITGGVAGSSSWYINSPNLTKNTLGNRSFINQLSYAVTISTTAIVGTNDGNVQYGFNLGQGTANSATWVNVTGSNAILPNRPILDVATSASNPLVGFAAIGGFDENTPSTPGHVYQVTCTASCASFTWVNKSGNLPDIPVDSIIANPNYPQQVFAGSDWGLYYTNDINAGSPVWYRFNAGLPNVMIWDMQIDQGQTTLALFTRSRGAYAWPLPSSDIATPTPGTATNTPVPSATATPTSILPTVTVPLPTLTITPVLTLTPAATDTPVLTATSTPMITPTETTTPAATPTDCPNPFTDINGNIFYTAIHRLNCQGVVNGTDATHYSPGGTSTRGQFAKVVVLGLGVPYYTPTGTQDFTDVPPSYFAYLYIESGYHAGILNGFDAASCIAAGKIYPCYLPNNPITRGQLTKLVVNARHYPLYTPTSGQDFTDVPPSNVFYVSIETAYHKGIVNGYPGHLFLPNNNIRRDEMAQIVYTAQITP